MPRRTRKQIRSISLGLTRLSEPRTEAALTHRASTTTNDVLLSDVPSNNYSLESLGENEQQIRLLRILPSTSDKRLRCQIEVYERENAPPYIALSYRWGRPGSGAAINLNGKSCLIRKNLHRCLQQIRSNEQFSDSFFWIDALCIDQDNTIERTHQVSMLAKTFEAASMVLIWLGPAYEQSELAMSFLRSCSSTRIQRMTSKVWRKPVAPALRSICQRAYWSRLWVVQEIALGRECYLMCGQQVVNYRKLKAFLDFCGSAAATKPDLGIQVFEHTAVVSSPAARLACHVGEAKKWATLIEQMRATRHLLCSDPRDKVYALRSLLSPAESDIRPDYALSLAELANRVLQLYCEQELPDTTQRLTDQCKEVASLLGIDIKQILRASSPEEAEFSSHADSLLTNTWTGFSLWWVHRYGHQRIEHLLKSMWQIDSQKACATTTFGLCSLPCDMPSAHDTAFLQAVWDGRLPTVRILHERADVNLRFWTQPSGKSWSNFKHFRYCKMTPLALAVQASRYDVLEFLLHADAHATVKLHARSKASPHSLLEVLSASSDQTFSLLSLAASTLNVPMVARLLSKPEVVRQELRKNTEKILMDIFETDLQSTSEGQAISRMLAKVRQPPADPASPCQGFDLDIQPFHDSHHSLGNSLSATGQPQAIDFDCLHTGRNYQMESGQQRKESWIGHLVERSIRKETLLSHLKEDSQQREDRSIDRPTERFVSVQTLPTHRTEINQPGQDSQVKREEEGPFIKTKETPWPPQARSSQLDNSRRHVKGQPENKLSRVVHFCTKFLPIPESRDVDSKL